MTDFYKKLREQRGATKVTCKDYIKKVGDEIGLDEDDYRKEKKELAISGWRKLAAWIDEHTED